MNADRLNLFFLSFFCIILLVCSNGCTTAKSDGAAETKQPPVSVPAEPAKKVKEFERGKFQPTVKAGSVVPLSQAHTIYRSSEAKPTGVYIHSGIVFVIVNIDTAQVKHRRNARGRAMLRSQAMLRKHFSLPARFNFYSRQLEGTQYYSKKFYRYCLAYSLDDIMNYKNGKKNR